MYDDIVKIIRQWSYGKPNNVHIKTEKDTLDDLYTIICLISSEFHLIQFDRIKNMYT